MTLHSRLNRLERRLGATDSDVCACEPLSLRIEWPEGEPTGPTVCPQCGRLSQVIQVVYGRPDLTSLSDDQLATIVAGRPTKASDLSDTELAAYAGDAPDDSD